ncbi:MAG: DUF6273 domain-containing protein [Clostridia bacterium]|nr:DUF6273 domain-containing protein [Clostridia bacterium]
MKLSKGQGISLFASLILFGIFNTVVFLAPLAHTVVFWLGYFFALFALITISLTLILYFGKPVKEDKFLNLPAVKVAWIYFILQTGLSVWEMIAFPLSYLPTLIINLVVGAVFSIIILSLYAASGRIDKSEQFTAEKVIFIKQLKLKLDSIETDNTELAKKIKELAEDVRFSDPMSHSKLAETERELNTAVDTLVAGASDAENAMALCSEVARLLKARNEQCKMYKGVKDTGAAQAQKSDNGLGIAFAGVCTMLAMFLITLSVCLIVVPQAKYNDAVALLETEKYDEATAAFTKIEGYRDSEEKIEEIKTILLDKKYDEAEKLFNAGKYPEAINIYTTLGDHKDSKLRIEQINNRLSDGDIIYFGTYNSEPIAWKILKTESNKMLLITENSIAQKPFTDDIKNVTWETSSLRTWLNEEFITSFSTDQQNQILSTNTGNTNDKVFLLSVDEIEELAKTVSFSTEEEWWTRSSAENSIKYMTAKDWAISEGDQVIRDKGVRPAVWISLD